MSRAKRDEWSCPCCGTPTDSSYCAPCDAAECGERDHDAPDIDDCLVERAQKIARARALAAKAIDNVRAWVEGR